MKNRNGEESMSEYPTEHAKRRQNENCKKGFFWEFVHPKFHKPGIGLPGCVLLSSPRLNIPDTMWNDLVNSTGYWIAADATVVLVLAEPWEHYPAGTIAVTDLYQHNGGWVALLNICYPY